MARTTAPYVATRPLGLSPFVLAYAVGDIVPDEAVEANGWEDGVARAGTKTADAAVEAVTEA